MFKNDLIYEKIGRANPNEIINAIEFKKNIMRDKNILLVKETEYYYIIRRNDDLVKGLTEKTLKLRLNGFREVNIDFDKINEIYYVDVKLENSQISNWDEIKEKYGLNDLKRKFKY